MFFLLHRHVHNSFSLFYLITLRAIRVTEICKRTGDCSIRNLKLTAGWLKTFPVVRNYFCPQTNNYTQFTYNYLYYSTSVTCFFLHSEVCKKFAGRHKSYNYKIIWLSCILPCHRLANVVLLFSQFPPDYFIITWSFNWFCNFVLFGSLDTF